MNKIIIYDFDGTLTPFPMPKFEILEKCGMKEDIANSEFLKNHVQKNQEKGMDLYTSIYETYFEIIQNAGLDLKDENFSLGYDKVTYNPGVFGFLTKLANNGIKNYLLSSGLMAFLKKVEIAPLFEEIFATTFQYDEDQKATGIKYLMSDKNKVEAIKSIINNNGKVENDCSDIVYIGDGLTDSYALEFVKNNGGTSILVYQDENSKDIPAMKEKNIVNYFSYSDFSDGSDLSNYVMNLCGIKNS